MARKSILPDSMTSAQRSARSLLQQRQELANLRTVLVNSVEMLLKNGNVLADLGKRSEALEMFQMAEIQSNQIEVINHRLRPHEDKLVSVRMPPRQGFPLVSNPMQDYKLARIQQVNDKLEHERLQAAYAQKRADLRPITEARFGHLARAEKTESVE